MLELTSTTSTSTTSTSCSLILITAALAHVTHVFVGGNLQLLIWPPSTEGEMRLTSLLFILAIVKWLVVTRDTGCRGGTLVHSGLFFHFLPHFVPPTVLLMHQ